MARLAAADDGVVGPDNPELAGGDLQNDAESVRAATGALFVVITERWAFGSRIRTRGC